MFIRSIKHTNKLFACNLLKFMTTATTTNILDKRLLITNMLNHEKFKITNLIKFTTDAEENKDICDTLDKKNKLLLQVKQFNNEKYLSIIKSDTQYIKDYIHTHVSKNIYNFDRMILTINKYNIFNDNILQKYYADFCDIKEYQYIMYEQIYEQIIKELENPHDLFPSGKYGKYKFVIHMRVLKKINYFNKNICDNYLDGIINYNKTVATIIPILKIGYENINNTNFELLELLHEMYEIGVDERKIKKIFF